MLHLIFAKRSGGKTTFCLNQLKAAYDSNQKAALLIPEQLSLYMEDKVIDTVGYIGNNIEVFSFLRLFRRLYSYQNRPKREYMDDVGKTMLINRILEKNEKDFLIFKPGKTANSGLLSAVTEFKRHFTSPENLDRASELFESGLSKQKFKEFSMLLSRYDEALSDSNADSSDNLSLLPELIEESGLLDDFTFYTDGFDGFTPQEASVIIALAKKAEVYVTLTYDKTRPSLFEPITNTVARLKKTAENEGVTVAEEFLRDIPSKLPASLFHIRESFGKYSEAPFEGEVKNIQVVSSDTPYGEAEACARRILKLIKRGMRLRDIVVLVPDAESYAPVLDKIFSDFSLPYFTDRRESISRHPLCRLIISLCDLFVQNFSEDAVLSFLKNEYCPISKSAVNRLEFFVSKTGTQGSDWQKEWDNAPLGFNLPDLNKTRESFMALVTPFREKTKGRTPCTVFCEAFTEFLKAIKADRTTNRYVENLTPSEVQVETGVWDSVLNVLEQLKITFGESSMGIEKIKNALSSGFSCCTVGKIPPTLDHITVSTADRNNFQDAKALFILGVTEGAFPPAAAGSGMITDSERTILSENGIELSQSNRQKALSSPFAVYMALTVPSELLCLCYPVENKSGEGVLPSSVIGDLKRMFKHLPEYSEIMPEGKSVITTPKATLSHFLRNSENAENPLWSEVYGWYEKNPEWKTKINRYLKSKSYTLSWKLKEQTAKLLWGTTLYTTISRLETFASCPLSFFLTYGLDLNKLEDHTFTPPEAGNMMHTVMENFVKAAIDGEFDWNELTFEDTKKRSEELCDIEIAKQRAKFPSVSKRYDFLLNRLKIATANAMWAVVHHIQSGIFVPVAVEMQFEGDTSPVFVTDKGNTIVLSGKIDRIDASDDGYRIIDYKSSDKSLDLSAVKAGRSLQLPIYSYALRTKFGKPKGMFYLAVEPKTVERVVGFSSDVPDEQLLKELRLSGYMVGNETDILNMDRNLGSDSTVIPAKNTKSKGITSTHLLTDDEYTTVEGLAISKAKEFGDAILEGDYPIRPVASGKNSSCDYCDFRSVCRFDPAYLKPSQQAKASDDEILGREDKNDG